MNRIAAWILPVLALFVGLALADEAEPEAIAIGAAAPEFRLNDQAGRAVSLSAYGKDAWTLIAFYPKSLTPG